MLGSRRLRETGDTILEVLICMAVVAGVLAGAFASANRSFTATRRAQERAEALKLAESQVERLREASQDTARSDLTGTFCLDASLARASAPCTTGFYNITVTESGGRNFAIQAIWERFGGDGNDEVIINYRI